jgi:hypothetical protein
VDEITITIDLWKIRSQKGKIWSNQTTRRYYILHIHIITAVWSDHFLKSYCSCWLVEKNVLYVQLIRPLHFEWDSILCILAYYHIENRNFQYTDGNVFFQWWMCQSLSLDYGYVRLIICLCYFDLYKVLVLQKIGLSFLIGKMLETRSVPADVQWILLLKDIWYIYIISIIWVNKLMINNSGQKLVTY